ncbi:MAG: DUF1624 domain-containing protein [Promethearchaeota archaeon]|nr:MAG: DUF1624 domain-containing protein [Candidatus Lokiarchaeota archaeon]
MKRIQAIDIFRGLCIFYMTFGHMTYWWTAESSFWLYELIWNLGAPVGGGGFLLVSGMSAMISYKANLKKAKISSDYTMANSRNQYILRALIILLISFIWNFFGALFMNVPGIWIWFVIQTISISLLLAWPFLKTSRLLRLFICFACWIGNEFLVLFLSPFRGQFNLLGIIYFILYNVPEQNVILAYFPYLLAGTVIGDIFYEAFNSNNVDTRSYLKRHLTIPGSIGGALLIIFGVFFQFPTFIDKATCSSHMCICGIELFIIIELVYLKDLGHLKLKRNYSVLKYYSFYSFTIFLAHNLLYFLFPAAFNALEIWLYIVPIMILWTYLFRIIYLKLGKYGSLKFAISESAKYIANKIDSSSLQIKTKHETIK